MKLKSTVYEHLARGSVAGHQRGECPVTTRDVHPEDVEGCWVLVGVQSEV